MAKCQSVTGEERGVRGDICLSTHQPVLAESKAQCRSGESGKTLPGVCGMLYGARKLTVLSLTVLEVRGGNVIKVCVWVHSFV